MKATTLALATVAVIALVAAEANAAGAISYPMSAQMAAKYGIQNARLPAQVRAIEQRKAVVKQASYNRRGGHNSGYKGGHGYNRGHGYKGGHSYHRGHGYHHGRHPVVYPPVVIAPYGGYYPVYRTQYYRPQYNIQYRGRGMSFGIGF